MGDNVKECSGFMFIHDFDSGNLGRVEEVPRSRILPGQDPKTSIIEKLDYEFNVWTRPDCAGTEFENGNRTWFYFGIQCPYVGYLVKINLMNLNKQGKMYSQGMAPVTRTLPGKPQWERIKDKPTFITDENSCIISFKYRTPDNCRSTTFFAFTYPFSYIELQLSLSAIDRQHGLQSQIPSLDDIYYHRECVCYSLEHRRVDLLTITSFHGILSEREPYLKNLFPDRCNRPFKFQNKKVIFVSARVHPGETPSSFVFNGFLNLLLTKNDLLAIALRKRYVFKLIPFLNPDGVARGHYRTDTRGLNLNRVYLAPSIKYHPTIFAARSLIRFYHFGYEKPEDQLQLEGAGQVAENIQYYSRSSTSLINDIISQPKSKMHSCKNDLVKPCSAQKTRDSPQPASPGSPIKSLHKERSIGSPSKSLECQSVGKSLVDQVGGLHLTEQPAPKLYTGNFGKYDVIYASPDTSQIDSSRFDIQVSSSSNLGVIEPNPLRNLKDTLKNSIYLLLTRVPRQMEDTSLASDDLQIDVQNQLMELCCQKCQKNLTNLEAKLPGLTDLVQQIKSESPDSIKLCAYCQNSISSEESNLTDDLNPADETVFPLNLESAKDDKSIYSSHRDVTTIVGDKDGDKIDMEMQVNLQELSQKKKSPRLNIKPDKEPESGLFLYIDLHGHASKKGIFMYGNHFEDVEKNVDCMLLPMVMSLNSVHFHFSSCNFTERNMYLRDRRDGMSREGSGRVAILKATGLIRSYTLECNYNTGRLVNVLPPAVRDLAIGSTPHYSSLVPPKYTPHIFEEVGKALGASILDLTEQHPNSRIPASEHRNLAAIKEWLRAHTRSLQPLQSPMVSRGRQRSAPPVKTANVLRSPNKAKVSELERKENTYIGPRLENDNSKRINKVCLTQDCSSKKSKRTGANNVKILAIRPRVGGDSSTLLKTKPLGGQRNLAIISLKKPGSVIKISNNQLTTSLGAKTKVNNLKRINDELNSAKTYEPDQGVSTKLKNIKSAKMPNNAVVNKEESKKKRKRSKDTVTKNPLMKPLRRLKMSQYKLGDVSKDKFRLKKKQNVISSSSVSSSDEGLATWDKMHVPTGKERISSSLSNLGQIRVDPTGAIGGNKRSRLHKLSHNTGELKKIRLKTNIV